MSIEINLYEGLQLADAMLAESDHVSEAVDCARDAIRTEHAQRVTLQHHAADLAQRVADLERETADLREDCANTREAMRDDGAAYCARIADLEASRDELRALIAAAVADARREGAEQMREAAADAGYYAAFSEDNAAEVAQSIRALPLPTGPREPKPSDPLDMPLPCDIKIGRGTHGKGTTLRGLVTLCAASVGERMRKGGV